MNIAGGEIVVWICVGRGMFGSWVGLVYEQ